MWLARLHRIQLPLALPFRTLALRTQPPHCEETQGTWRGHEFPPAALAKVSAYNQHQFLDMWKERPSNDSNPQLWSCSSWHLVEQKWVIPAKPCQNCRKVSKQNAVIALSTIFGWFVMQHYIAKTIPLHQRCRYFNTKLRRISTSPNLWGPLNINSKYMLAQILNIPSL